MHAFIVTVKWQVGEGKTVEKPLCFPHTPDWPRWYTTSAELAYSLKAFVEPTIEDGGVVEVSEFEMIRLAELWLAEHGAE